MFERYNNQLLCDKFLQEHEYNLERLLTSTAGINNYGSLNCAYSEFKDEGLGFPFSYRSHKWQLFF